MKNMSLNVPSTQAEAAAMAKRGLLSYARWASVIGVITLVSLFWNYHFSDATQSDQRFTVGFALVLYGWLAFLVFIGKSAEMVKRKWWAWMLTGMFFPVIGLIAAIIFRTSKTKA
ncbi:MAG: hypothetical protein O3C26_04240 [Actinomycetota bacterium]|nr:hypothetical protein [Actinomycetota bacterium]